MESNSFAPFIDKQSRILILGTMPGIKSLTQKEYYAHERNAFWPILFHIFKKEYTNKYECRINLLLENRIAIWDTLKFCLRKGSLDSDIQNAEPNDINELLKTFPNISSIVFNGNYAEKFYKRYNPILPNIRYLTMPSTSPANARLKFEQKLNKWETIKELL